ncbi:hypothetical protein K443DRAFT_96457 [Laccaria amethystina LaAM-08-1]|uniref:Major facilitator superfamily (MFS) profile domain-containing protein n=1 Tax=Laccaria amethystina LaAM-08-1 TaxID=1095629 RepID=A0A0C9Y3L7_9AGAR|nr:hypothetical protein K443DRAFT_96457 [Laccaria amethystina LaAM-08-1]
MDTMGKKSLEQEKPISDRAPTFHVLAIEVTEKDRQRLYRKVDFHILPFISFLYFLSFLDRSNIGNARIAGMAVDAKLTGLRYNVAAVFFISYALGEVPSNICLKLVRPSIWIPSMMVTWGLVLTLMCLCNTYRSLIIARFFLGLAEAGLFPGVAFYLSLWYRRRDVGKRIAIFFSAATLAGAPYGIEKMEGVGGLHGWQWIFCLEGIATVLVALTSYFLLYDYPESATFLTSEERAMIVAMLEEDNQNLATDFKLKFVWQAFSDYKIYVQIGIYIGLLIPIYAISLFLPTIINKLGFSSANAQLLTVPPFFAGCVSVIAVGIYSDKFNLRGPFIVVGAFVSLIGFIILYTQSSPGVSYFGTFLAAIGVFPTIPVDLAWVGSAAGGDVRKVGVSIALVIGVSSFGGICSSFIYITPPHFHIGHGTIMGWLSLSILLSLFAMWDYNRLNKINIAICQRDRIDQKQQEKYKDLGNDSPLFR